MKIRFTLGNIVGAATAVAGFVVNNVDAINTVVGAHTGGILIAAGTLILAVSKNLVTHQAHNIPEAKKVEAGPVVFEKTGPLKPEGL